MTMSQMSIATGRFTLATFRSPSAWNGPGAMLPSAMPTTMHRAAQRIR
jgi:hypothetical protein